MSPCRAAGAAAALAVAAPPLALIGGIGGLESPMGLEVRWWCAEMGKALSLPTAAQELAMAVGPDLAHPTV